MKKKKKSRILIFSFCHDDLNIHRENILNTYADLNFLKVTRIFFSVLRNVEFPSSILSYDIFFPFVTFPFTALALFASSISDRAEPRWRPRRTRLLPTPRVSQINEIRVILPVTPLPSVSCCLYSTSRKLYFSEEHQFFFCGVGDVDIRSRVVALYR